MIVSESDSEMEYDGREMGALDLREDSAQRLRELVFQEEMKVEENCEELATNWRAGKRMR